MQICSKREARYEAAIRPLPGSMTAATRLQDCRRIRESIHLKVDKRLTSNASGNFWHWYQNWWRTSNQLNQPTQPSKLERLPDAFVHCSGRYLSSWLSHDKNLCFRILSALVKRDARVESDHVRSIDNGLFQLILTLSNCSLPAWMRRTIIPRRVYDGKRKHPEKR